MKRKNTPWQNFLIGGGGYTLGAIAGVLFAILTVRIGLAQWIVGLITPGQPYLKILWTFLIAALLLAVSGAILGGIGGYALYRITSLKHKTQIIIGSAITHALVTGLAIISFLLLISLIGLYNNFSANSIQHYGLLFGMFGLVFGLLAGILQGLMTVKIRHSWRVILGAVLGFSLGSLLLGMLVRWMNPTEVNGPLPVWHKITLLIGLLLPFFFSGGFLGIAHGKMAERAKAISKGSPDAYISPRKWQTYSVAGIGLLIVLSALGFLSTLSRFLTINPAPLEATLQVESIGVHWSEPLIADAPAAVSVPDQGKRTISAGGVDYTAWCGSDGIIYYQAGSAAEEQILSPKCSAPPALAVDSQGKPHLVWYTEKIADVTGNMRPAEVLVESIRGHDGWSTPGIVAQTQGKAIPNLSLQSDGSLQLTWHDESGQTFIATQALYQCDLESLNDLERAGLDAVLDAGLRTENTLPHFCQNRYVRLEFTPNPDPAFSDEKPTTNGAFDQIAALVDTAQYEVLFTTMQYEPDVSPPSPGVTLADAVANLYRRVRDNPEAYPRGMMVRILLGNYPELSTFTYGDQIMDAISDLREAGVEKMVDPEIGWRVEVANFAGTYPHSHTKFVVVDGKDAISVGFNYGYLHLPKDHPSGKGYDMLDTGIQVQGPVAQDMIAAFDDMWDGANQIQCDDFHPERGDWTRSCHNLKAAAGHVPEVLRTYIPPEGESRFFSLYRSEQYPEGDTFIAAAMSNAQESINMLHVNFSLEAQCMLNLVVPNLCTFDNALPWMEAIVQAVETNQVHVRAVVENTNSNGLENRIGAQVLMDELARRGYNGYVEIRFYNGKLHAKSMLIDNQLLIIGSQNMHYSSWGEGKGLTEHSLATSDPAAIADYQRLFEVKWAEAIPFDEAEYGTSP